VVQERGDCWRCCWEVEEAGWLALRIQSTLSCAVAEGGLRRCCCHYLQVEADGCWHGLVVGEGPELKPLGCQELAQEP
jgi:hypothetical protein